MSPVVGVGSRAASAARDSLAGAASTAFDAGLGIERRVVDLVFGSSELERAVGTALDSPQLQSAIGRALSSDATRRLIDEFLAGRAFDALVDSLLASDGLWRLLDGVLDRIAEREALWRMVDQVAASPAVTSAITQQGFSFADQFGEGVRSRSRGADDLLERIARRLTHRRGNGSSATGEPPTTAS
jgi:hypothetical protein